MHEGDTNKGPRLVPAARLGTTGCWAQQPRKTGGVRGKEAA